MGGQGKAGLESVPRNLLSPRSSITALRDPGTDIVISGRRTGSVHRTSVDVTRETRLYRGPSRVPWEFPAMEDSIQGRAGELSEDTDTLLSTDVAGDVCVWGASQSQASMDRCDLLLDAIDIQLGRLRMSRTHVSSSPQCSASVLVTLSCNSTRDHVCFQTPSGAKPPCQRQEGREELHQGRVLQRRLVHDIDYTPLMTALVHSRSIIRGRYSLPDLPT
ncbi:hypothetical protein Z043_102343 [Scleropages formosus]|uniref:Uncharacterized protein n=1 Tax=Scleropages formosus TaxID=113540 RepID=A0A0P7V7T0_SCLFO|nr:hypothetical protein Z043_102343 [Scleropages formosus]